MRVLVLVLTLGLSSSTAMAKTFAERQTSAPRVKAAHKRASAVMRERFRAAGVAYPPRQVLLRGFKQDGELELWASSSRRGRLTKVHTFKVCAASGLLGNKSEQGDFQVPEGVYRVDRYNPFSSYHLSLGINYPNTADRRRRQTRGSTRPLGGDIFIHGDCVTIGCLPLEDGPIEELYVTLLDARLRHKVDAVVHLFPTRLDDDGMMQLKRLLRPDGPRLVHHTDAVDDTWRRWLQLQKVFAAFEADRRIPDVTVDGKGNYGVRPRR